MNILYVFHDYRDGDGASTAIDFLIRIDKPVYDSYLVVCKRLNTSKTFNAVEEGETNTIKNFLSRPDVLIHYVRASQSNILERVLSLSKIKVPIITTVVQSPSYKRLMLSPFEIKHTNFFVFIDKTAYNSSIISFIPQKMKSSIYLMQRYNNWQFDKTKDITLKQESSSIIYGRGSVLSKCPKDMFEVFDKINIKNKVFRIVGIPEGDNWVRNEAAKRYNVEVFPQLSSEKWFELCKTFDVFLYQLPNDSYASLDGTLGLAMCMRRPVVYMGCEAPKERIVNGESGFIAESVQEMAEYATALGNNYELRKRIGEKGRDRQIELSIENSAEDRFHEAYNLAHTLQHVKTIPLHYRLRYLYYCYKDIIRNKTNNYWK